MPRRARRWLRANFVSTLDGAATGGDHRSGSINTEADHVVFDLLRRLSDVVVVGAGTVRAEGYPSLRVERSGSAPVLVVVSHSGAVPDERPRRSGGVGPARHPQGRRRPRAGPVPRAARAGLRPSPQGPNASTWWRCESVGGPGRSPDPVRGRAGAVRQPARRPGVVDELDLTWSPKLVGGEPQRASSAGPALERWRMTPMLLLEEDGTLLGRWRVTP